MAITYDPVNFIITVTGYTEGTPCTLEDIYQADLAGGPWGVVTKPYTACYLFNARLVIGDDVTETWFKMLQEILIFTRTMLNNNDHQMETKVNATTTIGAIYPGGEAAKYTYYGCTIIDLAGGSRRGWICGGYSGSTIYLYSTSFWHTGSAVRHISANRAWNCYFGNLTYQLGNNKVGDFYNCSFSFPSVGFYYWNSATVIDRCYFNGCQGALMYPSANAVYRNIWAVNGPYTIYPWYIGANNAYLIDCTLDNWNVTGTADWSGRIYRQYSFDLHVTEEDGTVISGAAVKIYDKDGTLVSDVTTNGSGDIPTQTLNWGYYTKPSGAAGAPASSVLQTPHTFTITKDGFRSYTYKITIDQTFDLELSLELFDPENLIDAVVETTDIQATILLNSEVNVVVETDTLQLDVEVDI